MEQIQNAIFQMKETGVQKKDIIVVLNYEYAKKYLKESNNILSTPIQNFKTIYGVDLVVVNFLPFSSEFYIFTKEYWDSVRKFYE